MIQKINLIPFNYLQKIYKNNYCHQIDNISYKIKCLPETIFLSSDLYYFYSLLNKFYQQNNFFIRNDLFYIEEKLGETEYQICLPINTLVTENGKAYTVHISAILIDCCRENIEINIYLDLENIYNLLLGKNLEGIKNT